MNEISNFLQEDLPDTDSDADFVPETTVSSRSASPLSYSSDGEENEDGDAEMALDEVNDTSNEVEVSSSSINTFDKPLHKLDTSRYFPIFNENFKRNHQEREEELLRLDTLEKDLQIQKAELEQEVEGGRGEVETQRELLRQLREQNQQMERQINELRHFITPILLHLNKESGVAPSPEGESLWTGNVLEFMRRLTR
ncbi:uncharacterized protein VTP21DRAFT_7356 [Calcarisporiella thermophila]|uniref:uncharacterized protein n=1 Tax=Calcarisporiella thermophila TaxID=911321 RepID=UPI00374403D1